MTLNNKKDTPKPWPTATPFTRTLQGNYGNLSACN